MRERRLLRLARHQRRRRDPRLRPVHRSAKGSSNWFVLKADPGDPNAPGTISYPFDPEAGFDLDLLIEEAERQGNYRSSTVYITSADYPTVSNDQTVFFVDADRATDFLEYSADRAPGRKASLSSATGT